LFPYPLTHVLRNHISISSLLLDDRESESQSSSRTIRFKHHNGDQPANVRRTYPRVIEDSWLIPLQFQPGYYPRVYANFEKDTVRQRECPQWRARALHRLQPDHRGYLPLRPGADQQEEWCVK
jgi:hypothetical protein